MNILSYVHGPLINGDYPRRIRSLVGNRLLKYSKEQSKIVNGSFDFIGLNYYTSRYAAYAPQLKVGNASYLTDLLVKLFKYVQNYILYNSLCNDNDLRTWLLITRQ